MAWFKVDDRLYSHPKWMATPPRARALWVTAGSWCAANATDGRIPVSALRSLGGTKRDADSLVRTGLWTEVEGGWEFHEWTIYQPDAASEKARKKAESDAGTWGNHRRWHEKRQIKVPECEYCQGMPPPQDGPPIDDRDPNRVPDQVPDRVSIGSVSPVPVPDTPTNSTSGGMSPKQRASSSEPHEVQPCGRAHDPAVNCRGCARQREADEHAQRKERMKARSSAARIEARMRQDKIDACELCDETGRMPGGQVCPHRESAPMPESLRAMFSKADTEEE